MRFTRKPSDAGDPNGAPLYVACTWKPWLPRRTRKETGEVHAEGAAPSSEQLKPTPGAFEENAKLTRARFFLVLTLAFGAAVIEVDSGSTSALISSYRPKSIENVPV